MSIDFLVVGGGIGGAVLAGLLGRGGKKVVVLEKNSTPPNWARPEVLWPATVKVLFSLCSRETLESGAVLPLRGVVVLNNGRRTVLSITPELFQEAGIQPWSTDPNQTREQLLRLGTFELRRGVEVIGVLKERNRIVGVRTRDVANGEEREVLAHCTVGDDGAHSLVRQACGIDMKTRLFSLDFLCFGFDWPASLPPGIARGWMDFNRFSESGILGLLTVPLPNGKGAGLVPARPKVSANPTPALEAWSRLCSVDAAIPEVIRDRRFPQDFVRIRRAWGHAPRYGMEGAVLIGDAAHPVTPAGGQGANMSVADAMVLAELALRNQPNLLREYERRRRPANERSMGPTRVAARIWALPEWCFPASIFSWVVSSVARHPWLLRRFLRSASTAFQAAEN